MTRYVDCDHVDDLEQINADDTIGLITWWSEDDPSEGDTFVDVGRLRRALLAFEDEFSKDSVWIGFDGMAEADGDVSVLCLKPSKDSDKAIVLAPRFPEEANDLPTGDEDEEESGA